MENNHNPMEDDGSLDFLKIPADETNKHFNCPETDAERQRADISDCREPGGQARARPRFRRVRVLPQPNAHAQIHQAEFLPHGRASE